jgi:hypothetical protein
MEEDRRASGLLLLSGFLNMFFIFADPPLASFFSANKNPVLHDNLHHQELGKNYKSYETKQGLYKPHKKMAKCKEGLGLYVS